MQKGTAKSGPKDTWVTKQEDEVALPVIFDGGSRYFKVGYGGERAPRFVFPNVIGHYKSQSVMRGLDSWDTFVGNEVIDKRGQLIVKYPIERGIITNWDDMEKIWHHSFYNVLRINPGEHSLLLTENITSPKEHKEKLMEIMFEMFKVPALFIALQDVLSLFSSGRTTGLVVNSGDEMTYSVPIDGGYTLHDSITNLEVSGQDLTRYLTKILCDKGYSLRTLAEWEMVRDIKEKLCYVAADFIEEMQLEESTIKKTYELPDGRIITVGRERFRCPEVLFQPALLKVNSPGIHEKIHDCLMKCDFELRKIFYVNTILCGGSMLYQGINERVTKEIKILAPKMTKIKVIQPAEKFTSWYGGSVLTTLTSFQRLWINNYEYEDFGPSIVYRRCF